jgi:hypothetical protein
MTKHIRQPPTRCPQSSTSILGRAVAVLDGEAKVGPQLVVSHAEEQALPRGSLRGWPDGLQ